MGRRHVRPLAGALLVVPLALPARAETTTVRVQAPCPLAGTTVDAVTDILRAQLAPLPVSSAPVAPATNDVAVLIDACRSAGANLDLLLEHRGQRLLRRVDLGDVETNARGRTLALALAEAVQQALDQPETGASTESTSAAPSSTPAVPPRPPEAARKPTPPAPPASSNPAAAPGPAIPPVPSAAADAAAPASALVRLEVAPLVRYVFKTGSPYFGLSAGAGVRRYTLKLRALTGQRRVDGGSVRLSALLGALSVDWLALAPSVSVRSELELGAALAVPNPDAASVGHTATSPHVGATTDLRLAAPLSPHWVLESELAVGVASSLTAAADRNDVMSLSGVFVHAAVGVGWDPGTRKDFP